LCTLFTPECTLKSYIWLIRLQVFDNALSSYYALIPSSKEEGCYLFFDEIQEMPEWGTFLGRIVDNERATTYVTGSSSRMPSSEIPSEFRASR